MIAQYPILYKLDGTSPTGTSASSYINYNCEVASTTSDSWVRYAPTSATSVVIDYSRPIYRIDGKVYHNNEWRDNTCYETGNTWYETSGVCGTSTSQPLYTYLRQRIKTPQEVLREIIVQRHAPGIVVVESKRPMSMNVDIREKRARETLSRLIGQERFSRFLKQGFISAKNRKSGKVYQIFPGSGITKVFENGNLTARLCVVLKGNFPPTDSLIVRYLLALNDEDKLWSLAIKHNINSHVRSINVADSRSLIEIYSELKQKVA
jgi:hypothetical protein